MDLRLLATVFATVLVAELGDKTQLATLLYAADARSGKLAVFLGSAGALLLSSALAVLAGAFLSRHLEPRLLSWIAGAGFIAIGLWTLMRA